jgi:hypothetical protein
MLHMSNNCEYIWWKWNDFVDNWHISSSNANIYSYFGGEKWSHLLFIVQSNKIVDRIQVIDFSVIHQVIVTERAGQAFDMMSSMTNKELNSYDGVIAVVRT